MCMRICNNIPSLSLSALLIGEAADISYKQHNDSVKLCIYTCLSVYVCVCLGRYCYIPASYIDG